MKLFLLATLSLFVSSGAVDVQRQSTGLRSIGVEAFSDVNTLTAVDEVYISTMLEVHGGDWKHVHDDDHVPAMTKCLLASYNKQDMMGFEMKSVNPKKEIDIPEDGDDEADNEMLQKNYYRSMAYLLVSTLTSHHSMTVSRLTFNISLFSPTTTPSIRVFPNMVALAAATKLLCPTRISSACLRALPWLPCMLNLRLMSASASRKAALPSLRMPRIVP